MSAVTHSQTGGKSSAPAATAQEPTSNGYPKVSRYEAARVDIRNRGRRNSRFNSERRKLEKKLVKVLAFAMKAALRCQTAQRRLRNVSFTIRKAIAILEGPEDKVLSLKETQKLSLMMYEEEMDTNLWDADDEDCHSLESLSLNVESEEELDVKEEEGDGGR